MQNKLGNLSLEAKLEGWIKKIGGKWKNLTLKEIGVKTKDKEENKDTVNG